MLRAQERRVHQHVEGIAARGCGGGIRGAGGGEVTSGIRRGLCQIVNVVEFLVRVARKDEVMMSQMLVAPVEPEVKDYTRTRRLVFPALLKAIGNRPAEQFAIGAHRVFIGHHSVKAMLSAVVCFESGNSSA